jgi:tumor protein p53-inducible protein 3
MALLSGGGYAQFVKVKKDHTMSVPQGMSFEQAAAIPEAFATAYQLLF